MIKHPQPHQQKRLLGKSKWTTLRQHSNVLTKLLKHAPKILRWNEDPNDTQIIHNYLDKTLDLGHSPGKLKGDWATLNWICRKMGYSPPDDEQDLQSAYEQTTTQLSSSLYRPTKRAHMPTDAVLTALENRAQDNTKTQVYRYFSSALRAATGISSIYADMQHTAPRTIRDNTNDVQLEPWQTKTERKGV